MCQTNTHMTPAQDQKQNMQGNLQEATSICTCYLRLDSSTYICCDSFYLATVLTAANKLKHVFTWQPHFKSAWRPPWAQTNTYSFCLDMGGTNPRMVETIPRNSQVVSISNTYFGVSVQVLLCKWGFGGIGGQNSQGSLEWRDGDRDMEKFPKIMNFTKLETQCLQHTYAERLAAIWQIL